MRKWIVLFVAIMISLFSTGCGYKEGVIEPDRQSYIWFNGNTNGAVVTIDDNAPFTLDQSQNAGSETGTRATGEGRMLYRVTPGKHEIVVKKGGKVVVHRVLMIGTGATREVLVP